MSGEKHTFYCYQCDRPVKWLAPDGRGPCCTKLTPELIRGDVEEEEDHASETQR